MRPITPISYRPPLLKLWFNQTGKQGCKSGYADNLYEICRQLLSNSDGLSATSFSLFAYESRQLLLSRAVMRLKEHSICYAGIVNIVRAYQRMAF